MFSFSLFLYMIKVSTKTYRQLCQLLGRRVHFKSDCEFFPNFDVIGKVIEIHIGNNLETIFKFLHLNGKVIEIGSNMKNLRYELLN